MAVNPGTEARWSISDTVFKSGSTFVEHLDIIASPHHISAMRTTLDLDEDVVRAGKSLARQRAKSLGKVISELARIGMAAGSRVDLKQGFPVFTVDVGTGPITLEDVNRSEDEA